MNAAVEMTVNQFQQNISIKLADDYLSTLLTGNVMKFPVDLTKIFNSARVYTVGSSLILYLIFYLRAHRSSGSVYTDSIQFFNIIPYILPYRRQFLNIISYIMKSKLIEARFF